MSYKRRILRPDSRALTYYARTSGSRLSPSQKALLARLQDKGYLPLHKVHASSLAGLVRRGLARFDTTHAYPTTPTETS